MNYQKFNEYLTSTKKLETSGKVKKIADFEGKVDASPKKESKHKHSGGEGQVGTPHPYKNGKDAKDPNKECKDGFAHKGDKSLKYEPKEEKFSKEGGKTTPSWPKTKTQEWVEKTKNMSLAEFTKNLRNAASKGLNEGEEIPHNLIKETVSVCKRNNSYVSALVREMKRNGLFNDLFEEMNQHPESYKVIAKSLEKDESYARKLVQAMNEFVDPNAPSENPFLKKKTPFDKDMSNSGEGEGLDTSDEANPDDMEDGMEDDMDMEDGEENPDDLEGENSEDMGDEEGLEGSEEEMPSEEPNDGSGLSAPMGSDLPVKKKHGIDHLLGAMKNHKAMQGAMESVLNKKTK